MGSWYQTCALSGLPVCYQHKAVGLLLTPGVRHLHRDGSFSYAEALWKPSAWPIRGVYEDSGVIEKVKVTEQPLFAKFVKEHIWNCSLPDKKVPSKEFVEGLVHPDDDDDDAFDPNNQPWYLAKELTLVLVRDDVWKGFLDLPLMERWSDERIYRKDYVTRLVEDWEKDWKKHPVNDLKSALHRKTRLECASDSKYLRDLVTRVPREDSFLCDSVAKGDATVDQVLKVLPEIADVMFIEQVMNRLRKYWSPQCGAGSQDVEWKLHRAYHECMSDIADLAREKEEQDL